MSSKPSLNIERFGVNGNRLDLFIIVFQESVVKFLNNVDNTGLIARQISCQHSRKSTQLDCNQTLM